MNNRIKFQGDENADFFSTLQARVNEFFRVQRVSKSGGNELIIKSLILLAIFTGSFAVVIVFEPGIEIAIGLLILMGIGKAAVGMSIMHDALHGSFSKKKWLNAFFGGTLYLLGGNPINWKIQHNVLHHTYPNIYKVDEDVSTKGFILRLSPASKVRSIHRYQWLYILPLYGLMTLSFMVKDFRQLHRYNKIGETHRQGLKPVNEMFKLIVTKLLYITGMIGLPLLTTNYSLLQVVIGFLIVHFTAGIILSLVFQLAHAVENVAHPERDSMGNINSSWAIHQLVTTSNFAPKSKLLHWFTGGLNFQVEHHLFPHISHIHYRKIAPIVKQTADEFGIIYNSAPTLWVALKSHFRMLKRLGEQRKLEFA